MQKATFIQRFAAYLIDAIIVAIVVGILDALIIVAGSALLSKIEGDFSTMMAVNVSPMLIAYLLDLALTVAYYGYFWATTGQTLGKRVMQIKVVKTDGSTLYSTPLTWNDALARSAGYILSGLAGGLGFLWALWDNDDQTWHDKMAGTSVIKAGARQPVSPEVEAAPLPASTSQPGKKMARTLAMVAGVILACVVCATVVGIFAYSSLMSSLDPNYDRSNAGLTQVPPEVLRKTDLETLNLDSNQITTLPPQIGQLAKLKRLSLWNNRLTALPPEIGQLTDLQELELTSNQLTALPPEIGRLTKLEKLNLQNNRLSTLPPEVGQLSSLKHLNVVSNTLTAFPPAIGQLTHLEELFLNDNQLLTVPPEIGRMTNLTELYLAATRLTAVPPEIGQLVQLEDLNLFDNQLISVPPHRPTGEPSICGTGQESTDHAAARVWQTGQAC